MSFPEAVRIVAQKCGIPLPKKEYSSPEEAAEARLRRKLLDLHEAATAWFEEQLRGPEGAVAREYLAGRGLTPEGIKRTQDISPNEHGGFLAGSKWIWLTVVIAALAFCLFLGHRFLPTPQQSVSAPTQSSDKSIAVLPFVDLSQAKDQEYFCDGISAFFELV